MSDAMKVGRLALTMSQALPELAPPKPPKRVAVQVAIGDGKVGIVASDGTAWTGRKIEHGWNRGSEWHWTRLPDLPQE